MKKSFGSIVACAVFGASPWTFAASASDDIIYTPATAEIVITAERRSQFLQNVPVSVTALTAADIEKSRLESVAEMQQSVPGLSITKAAPGQTQIFIRGIGTDIVGPGLEDAVPVYMDGVYQSRASGTAMQFVDVDRVEILKGPQGVLYGRNATGGAINIISRAPTWEQSGQFDVQGGSYNQKMVRGTVSGPLSYGSTSGRLSFLHNRNDGDTRNILLNVMGNSSEVNALRGTLEFLPNDMLSVTVHAHYYHDNDHPIMKPLYPALNPLFTHFGATVINNPRIVMQNQQSAMSHTQSGIDVKTEWDLESKRLTSITAINKTDDRNGSADLDGTEIPLMKVGSQTTGAGIREITNFFSQEFTLVSSGHSPLAWTGLLSYNHQKVDAPEYNVSLPLLNLTQNSVAIVSTDSIGAGGQATYSWTNGVRLTVGARYSTETKNLEKDLTYANGTLTGSKTDKKTWSSVTPKFVVDYSPDRNNMFYASATKGFKSGGYNTISIQPAFAPETAINYEVGLKSKLFGDSLQLNLAAFYTRYNDMQLSILQNNAGVFAMAIQNAAQAVSKGMEASFVANPTSRLELSGGLQFLEARFTNFVSIDPRYPTLGAQNLGGNPLSRAPDTTLNLATQYTWPLEHGSFTLRGEGYYRSKVYYTPFRDDYASGDALSLWNVLLSYKPYGKSGPYGSFFVKNLADKTYAKTIFDPPGLGYLAYYASRRTIGAQVGYRY